MATVNPADSTATSFRPAVKMHPLRERQIFFRLSLLCLFIAVAGFLPSYWLRLPNDGYSFPGLLHLHAAAFTAWPLLLCTQAWLASRGSMRRHRAFGLAGISLATLMLSLGMALAFTTLRHRLDAGDGDSARSFMIVSFTQVSMFFGFFVAAIVNAKRPQWHMRLMIVATLIALGAAIQRWVIFYRTGHPRGLDPPAPPVASSLTASLLACGIMVVIMVWEWRTRGRPHPAWLIGVGVVLATILLRIPVSQTQAWLAFAQWTAELAGT